VLPTNHATACEMPKSVELEVRVSRLELLINDMRDAVEVVAKRTAAIQAQLDHLDARLRRR
jgi:uncharacterized coiled-coil protein SlyX